MTFYGRIAGDALLRRLGKILITVGLDAYHHRADRFLCKGESRQELNARLSQARQIFREPFQVYGDGRIQTIEGAEFSFGIGTTPEEEEAALCEAKRAYSAEPATGVAAKDHRNRRSWDRFGKP
jgi:hypothetical protein